MAKTISKQKPVINGIILITLGILLSLSIISYNTTDYTLQNGFAPNVDNMIGHAGAFSSHVLIQYTFGFPVIIVTLLMIVWGFQFLRNKLITSLERFSIYSLFTMVMISYGLAIIHEFSIGGSMYHYEQSGLLGGFLANNSSLIFGKAGTIIIYTALLSILVSLWTRLKMSTVMDTLEKLSKKIWKIPVNFSRQLMSYLENLKRKETLSRKLKDKLGDSKRKEDIIREKFKKKFTKEESSATPPEVETRTELVDEQAAPEPKKKSSSKNPLEKYYGQDDEGTESEIKINKPKDIRGSTSETKKTSYVKGKYTLPSLDLLNGNGNTKFTESPEWIKAQADILETTLSDFGVFAKVVEVHPGPVLTLYELKPDTGVKVSKILSLQDDMALAMKAKGIRLIAPIPGKDSVGVEIPNANPATIYLKDILSDPGFKKEKSKLTMALGRTTTGEVYYADLAKMPHLLVAGQTGAGKSVGINTIIASILYNATPEEVQFVMIDPKMVELSLFKKLKMHHLMTADFLDEDVITKPANAVLILKSLVTEMENRYRTMAHFGVRNIEDYNAKKDKKPNEETGEVYPAKFEYIVVIVDELADLMLVAQKEVEEPIARIAQMARAVGIHMILATQRPSVDVLTGFIKSNFPARIAYRVFSSTDSRTILDMPGANQLIGKGDMLFLPPGMPKPVRIQNAFLSTEEIDRVIDHVSQQAKFPKITELTMEIKSTHSGTGGSSGGDRDTLFSEAAKIIITHQQGSISLLQRRLKIGYSRAARLVDEMEEAGIVGPYDGSKARQVLVDEDDLEDYI